MRKVFITKLVGRVIILVFVLSLFIVDKSSFDILYGWNFFKSFSYLHLLWMLWMLGTLEQMIPRFERNRVFIPLGCLKQFKQFYVHSIHKRKSNIENERLREYIIKSTNKAVKIAFIWALLILILGIPLWFGLVGSNIYILVSALFYVCDLICVLVWCPFRLFLGNKCCTTCRIYNWDRLMMFSPLIYIQGFYGASLLGIAIVQFLMWEYSIMLYPERFYQETNMLLRCSNCVDKLCTQCCNSKIKG